MLGENENYFDKYYDAKDKIHKLKKKNKKLKETIEELTYFKNEYEKIKKEPNLLKESNIPAIVAPVEVKKVEKKEPMSTVEDDPFKRFGLLEID